MKKDIKSEILETGLRLFREQGYSNVSMRNIADALGMSVGNLTYHFKKKEDLIEAVIINQHQSFVTPQTPTNLEELNEFFLRGVEHQKSDDYFFAFYDELKIISPKIYNIQVGEIKKRKKKIQEAFKTLQKNGLMCEDEVSGQMDALIDVINIIKIYWTPDQEALSDAKDSPINCLWSIIYPRLTEEGKKIYKEKIKN